MPKRICIIGAAASGLPAIKCCLADGLTPVCYERTDDIGGLWNYHEKAVNNQSSVTKTTVINTSKEMMCYSDFPIPEDYPNFCHHSKVLEYFRMYADHFKLLQHVRFRHEILSIKKRPDFATSGQWSVLVKDLESGKDAVEEVFDGVLLCTGHHAMKRLPTFPDQEKFKGKTLHVNEYRSHVGYEDKNVVIVGIGNSGGDIAVDLSKIARQVYLSTRRGAWVCTRMQREGMPWDCNDTTRSVQMMREFLGLNWINSAAEKQCNMNFNHKAFGLDPKHRFFGQHPTVNDELPNRLCNGTIKIKPNISRFLENGVEFTDGTKVEADVVVFATGYIIGFPYLDKEVLDIKDNVVELFKNQYIPDLRPSTLAIIGCMQPWGAIMPISELQCRLACQVFKGAVQLPPPDVMWAEVNRKNRELKERYAASPRHTIQVDWIPFMDEVAELFGAKPKLGELFRKDPALAWECFFGPCTPYQYRLFGPNKWAGAREAIMSQRRRIFKGFYPDAEPPSGKAITWYIGVSVVVVFLAWLLIRMI